MPWKLRLRSGQGTLRTLADKKVVTFGWFVLMVKRVGPHCHGHDKAPHTVQTNLGLRPIPKAPTTIEGKRRLAKDAKLQARQNRLGRSKT